jgi:hypothetical protein
MDCEFSRESEYTATSVGSSKSHNSAWIRVELNRYAMVGSRRLELRSFL